MNKPNKNPMKQSQDVKPGTQQQVVGLLPRPTDSHEYKMGFDAAKNGANTTNCHFTLFATKAQTAEWERGNRDAKQQSNAKLCDGGDTKGTSE